MRGGAGSERAGGAPGARPQGSERLFGEHEFVLPTQVFERRRVNTPELRLLVAVLDQAVDDARKPVATELRRRAWSWFLNPDRTWPFSFVAIAEALGLDPDAVRARLSAPPPVPRVGRHTKPRGGTATPTTTRRVTP